MEKRFHYFLCVIEMLTVLVVKMKMAVFAQVSQKGDLTEDSQILIPLGLRKVVAPHFELVCYNEYCYNDKRSYFNKQQSAVHYYMY